MKNQIRQMLEGSTRGALWFDEPLAKHTTFGIGGPAECLVYPADKSDLMQLLRLCEKYNIVTHFIGSGSNVLANSSGVEGLVISLEKNI